MALYNLCEWDLRGTESYICYCLADHWCSARRHGILQSYGEDAHNIKHSCTYALFLFRPSLIANYSKISAAWSDKRLVLDIDIAIGGGC